MKTWTTEIKAICQIDKVIKTFAGPNINAISKADALKYCQNNGLGYLHISDELVMEIPCVNGTLKPDWSNAIDYEDPQLN